MMRKAFYSGVTTFLMLLAIAVVFEPAAAMAQPGGGGRGAGRGGMMGGMGGGGVLGILMNEERRAELKLTDEQVEKLQELGKDLAPDREKMTEIFGKMRDASDDERAEIRKEVAKLTEDMAKKADEGVAKILDEAQYKRVKQLALRAGGVRLITTDENAKALGLTDEQKEKINAIMRENRGQGGGGGQRMSREERAKQREELEEKVTAELTDEQKSKWKEMLGPEPAAAN